MNAKYCGVLFCPILAKSQLKSFSTSLSEIKNVFRFIIVVNANEEKVKKIVITRPVVQSGRGLGHLPGTLIEKINPYLVPILEEMNMYLLKSNVELYRDQEIIELCPLEYMRGRNFHNCFMILDEAQNATFEQIKMFVTRLGRNSKAVINGDLKQSDLGFEGGGLLTCMDELDGVEGVSICELDYSDIIRSDVVARILRRLHGV